MFSELLHYCYFKIKLHTVQKLTKRPVFSKERRLEVKKKMYNAFKLAHHSDKYFDALRDYFTGWFHHCEFEKLHRDNIKEYICANTLYKLLPDVTDPDELAELDRQLELVESLMEYKFPSGKNLDLEFVSHTREPVRALYRPLALYLLFWFGKSIIGNVLYLRGFKFRFSGQMRYWHRKPKNAKAGKPPIVFFHGISPGMVPYYPLLMKLGRERELFIVELPWVSMKAWATVPEPESFVNCIDLMLHRHKHETACIAGHSYGTVIAAYILKYRPRIVASMVLLDPISILVSLPNVCMNFLYSQATYMKKYKLSYFQIFVLAAFTYISAREIGIAETLCRHFWWYEILLLAEDLPRNTTVVLSGKDHIVPSGKIRRYLTRWNEIQMKTQADPHTIRVQVRPGLMHGGFITSMTEATKVASLILTYH
jgi:pimeloyl-ACP methyl ester carboxylesterase